MIVAALAGPMASPAANVTLTNSDTVGSSSLNSALNWSNGQAPSSGNTYSTGAFILRTPTGSSSYTFQGASLTINTNGNFYYKGSGSTGTITVNNLILAGGSSIHNSSASDVWRLAGNVNVAADSVVYAKQGPIVVTALISGNGRITNPGADATATILTISNNANSFTGSIVNDGRLVLAAGANLNFAIGASGVNNGVSGSGAQTDFNGRFVFDLSGASANLGDSWTVASALAQGFGSTFSVDGFARQGGGTGSGTWDFNAGSVYYEFSTASGVLSVVSSPNTNAPPGPPGLTGVKVAYIPVDDGNTNTSEYGYAGINTAAFIRSALMTVGHQQFLAYYYRHETSTTDTNNNRIAIARRDIGSKLWQVYHTSFAAFDITDGHDVVCFGIDGEGYMHLSWGMHNNTLNYARSTGPVTGNVAITFTSLLPMTGGEVTNTYPQFLSLPNGDLLFYGRRGGPGGGSGGGDEYLDRWSLATHTWTNVNMSGGVFQPFIKGYWSAATNYNAYLNMPCIDTNGNLFLTWTWRETPAYESNHDLFYAQSPDGGVTWQRSDNTPYTLPICQSGIHETGSTNSIPEKIVSIPQNYSLINQAGMCLDGNNDPVIATWWAPASGSGDYRRQYIVAFPDSNGVWQTRQVSNRTNDPAGTMKLDADVSDLGRPVVVADKDNRLIVLYRDNFGSNGLTVVHSLPYAVDPLRTNWTTIDLTSDNLGGYEPVIDLSRWQRDNVLDILYQPIGGQGAPAPENNASQVAVLEWDTAAYFNHNPPMQIALTNANQDVALSWPSQTGWGYKVQTSTNLTSWTDLGTLNGNEATLQYVHTNATADPARFWRLQVKEGGFGP